MAITRREPGASLIVLWLGLGLGAGWHSAFAQTTLQSQVQSEPGEAKPTTQIQPMLDATLTATNNAQIGTTKSDIPRKDVLLRTTVGADLNIKGANSHVDGKWSLTSIKYARHSQSASVLPSGNVKLHSDLYRKELGVDAAMSSTQTSNTVGIPYDPNTPVNTTTNTRRSISPFFYRQFDSESSLWVSLQESWRRQVSNNAAVPFDQKGTEYEHKIRWERRPARLGYELEGSSSKTLYFVTASSTSLKRKRATISPLYALIPELVVGPVIGSESDDSEGHTSSGVIHGAQLRWRPNEHTQLLSKFTDGPLGKEWMLDASRKTAWTTLGLRSSRDASPDPNAITPNSSTILGAVSSESTSGRMQFTGRRDSFNVSAGLNRSTPIKDSTGLRTKTYFFETEATHKLTPFTNLRGSLRWTRGVTFNLAGPQPARDFAAQVQIDTKLAPDTTAKMGLRRQLTHSPDTTHNPAIRNGAESAAFVGLGYRF